MKLTTIYLEENVIEVHNSFLGKETIIVNDEIVSEKRSFFGTEHNFNLIENDENIECRIKLGISLNGAVFNLHKNNKPVIISLK